MTGTEAAGNLQRQVLQLASRAWRGAWKLLPDGALGLRQKLAVQAQRLFGRPPAPPRVDRADPAAQERWLRRHAQPSRAALARALAAVARWPAPPRFLVLLPESAGRETRAALAAQHYPHWECGPGDPATADWVVLLRPGETLAPAALLVLALAVRAQPQAEILYADEGGAGAPFHFKPDFDLDLHLGLGLFGPATAYRGPLAARLRRDEPAGFPLRAALTVAPSAIHHVPVPLAPAAAPLAPEARRAALRAALAEAGLAAEVSPAPGWPEGSRLRWPVPRPAPLVSVIVPTRDRAGLLAACAEGVLDRTAYRDIEFIIVDNGSTEPETHALFARLRRDPRVRILPVPGPFNYSALNNRAAAEARGEVLLLLNNDVEVIGPDWLDEMVGQVMRPGIGAVGARLLYTDGRLQHGGVILGIGGVADHYLTRAAREDAGPSGSLALVREVSAVTAACLAVRRDAYLAVGGLDAERLTVAFNDVDFCLKLRAAGLRNLWTPFAELYHHESASRGLDATPEQMRRFASEIATMRERWSAELDGDPFYPPNLSLDGAFAALAEPPRRPAPWDSVG